VGGPVGIGDLASGKRKFSDPDILDTTEKWLRLRDYTNRGAATTDDDQALQQMLGGKAAMAVAGPASLSALRAKFKDAAAVAKLPTISPAAIEGGTVGGTGVAFIVLKNSKRKQEAVDFIKHLLSAEEQKTFAESGEPGPLVGRTDAKGYYSDPLFNQLQAWGVEPSNTFWPDNTFSAELVNELSTQAQLTWNGKLTAKQFLAKLDQKRDSLG
jgi:ABC-type glycerol-3-phosphate transport system substrate-binding protein